MREAPVSAAHDKHPADGSHVETASVSATRRPSLRLLTDMADLSATEDIQRTVWGVDDSEVVPASQMRAAIHAGGHVVGAFFGGALVGFAYALVATPHGTGMAGVGLHSHMLAVLPDHRRHGLGQELKWFQRRWCLERGLTWISWTFDPLQAKNANLNFRHLGVVCRDYLIDFYGPMSGTLGGGQPSDRLLALWLLESANVTELARGASPDLAPSGFQGRPPGAPSDRPPGGSSERPPSAPSDRLPGGSQDNGSPASDGAEEIWLLTPKDIEDNRRQGGDALEGSVTSRTREALTRVLATRAEGELVPSLRIAVPGDVTALLGGEPVLARLWRLGVRAAMTLVLDAGMVISSFENGAYRATVPREFDR